MKRLLKINVPIDGQWHAIDGSVDADEHSGLHYIHSTREVCLWSVDRERHNLQSEFKVISDNDEYPSNAWYIGSAKTLRGTFYHLIMRYLPVPEEPVRKRKWYHF